MGTVNLSARKRDANILYRLETKVSQHCATGHRTTLDFLTIYFQPHFPNLNPVQLRLTDHVI